MRLLLLLPNFVLMAISGYNLSENAAANYESNYMVYTLLHILVMAVCILFTVLIIRSAFRVSYVPSEEDVLENEPIYAANI